MLPHPTDAQMAAAIELIHPLRLDYQPTSAMLEALIEAGWRPVAADPDNFLEHACRLLDLAADLIAAAPPGGGLDALLPVFETSIETQRAEAADKAKARAVFAERFFTPQPRPQT